MDRQPIEVPQSPPAHPKSPALFWPPNGLVEQRFDRTEAYGGLGDFGQRGSGVMRMSLAPGCRFPRVEVDPFLRTLTSYQIFYAAIVF